MKMCKKTILGLLFQIISVTAIAQGGSVYVNKEWQDSTGNPTFNPILNPFGHQWSNSILSSSGHILTVGHSDVSAQGENIYLIKHDADGNVIFQVDFNTSGTQNDYGIGICEASNGDILLCGTTDNGGSTNYDIVIIRCSAAGVLINSTTKDKAGMNDIAVGIKEDASGNIIVAANAEAGSGIYDYWVLKYSSSLSFSNDNTYDYAGLQDIAIGLEFTSTGEICIIGASASSTTSCDYALAMFDSGLSYLSDHRNNLPGTALDQATAYVKDASNNTYITGKAWNGTNFDIKTIKVTPTFSIAWSVTTDVNSFDDAASSIVVDQGGNIIVGGYATNSSNFKEIIYMKYSSTGTILWQHTLPSANPAGDAFIQKLAVNASNGNIYFLAAEKGASGLKQALIGKIKPSGERNWLKNINDPIHDILPSDLELGSDGIYAITILNPVTASYQTTKFSELLIDTTAVFDTIQRVRLKNYLLVSFQQNALQPSKINNRDIEHGILSDFITSTALANLIEITDLREIGYYKCHKILPWMVMDDSMSITRSGRLIKIFPHYTTFGLVLPGTSHDSIPLQKISLAPNIINSAQYNRYVFLNATTNDPEYTNGNSSGLTTNTFYPDANINVEPAWDLSTGDPTIKIGVFDTGINFEHLDFGNGTYVGSKIAGGYNYDGNVPLSTVASNDVMGHGTAVADKIGALRNNNYAIAGIAGGNGAGNKGVTLYDMKIFGNGSDCNYNRQTFAGEGSVYNAIVQGAINNTVTGSGFVQNIQNHSWGGLSMYGVVQQAFITAYQNEVMMVVAAGNGGIISNCMAYSYPASYKDHIVTKVGANYESGDRVGFSECGHRLDLIAPGVKNLYSSLSRTGTAVTDYLVWTAGNNMTCSYQIDGTSFAAPHVAGAAALMLSYANNTVMPNGLFPEDIEQLMQLAAKDLTFSPNFPGYDSIAGFGRLDIGKCLSEYYYPGYLVQHYTFNVSASTAYSVGAVFENTCLWQSMFGQPFGIAKARRYKITGTNSHTIPTGYTFIAGWERNAGSNLMGINTNTAGFGGGAINCATTGIKFEEDRYLPDATRILPVSITSTSASFEGYIYELFDPATNASVGWYPFSPSGTGTFAYSLYLRSLTVDLNEELFTENSFLMFPNPTMDRIYFKARIKEAEHIDVAIFSSVGQLVFKQDNLYIRETNFIDVSYLSNGVYFAKITSGNKTLVNKIIVAK
jgi:subtilisin family serine protease